MPLANRHCLPGRIWHITHRCHKKELLLKFARDRRRWVQWLFEAKKRYGLRVLNCMASSNHIPLRVRDNGERDVVTHRREARRSTGFAQSPSVQAELSVGKLLTHGCIEHRGKDKLIVLPKQNTAQLIRHALNCSFPICRYYRRCMLKGLINGYFCSCRFFCCSFAVLTASLIGLLSGSMARIASHSTSALLISPFLYSSNPCTERDFLQSESFVSR